MRDDRTQDALDHLADLFLTGLDAAARAAPEERSDEGVAGTPGATGGLSASVFSPTPTPLLSESGVRTSEGAGILDTDMLDGPAPIRLTPKIRARDQAAAKAYPRHDPPEHEMDMLGPFVLSGPAFRNPSAAESESSSPSDMAAEAASPPPEVHCEAILLGNLPGVSGPWMAQYARRLAQSRESAVAVVRMAADHVSLDLVGGGNPQPIPHSSVTQGADLVELLDSLARRSSQPVRTLLIHDETWTTPTPSLDRLRMLRNWTVLCGADDAATAGVRQLLASLISTEAVVTDQHLGVMMMGSAESVAGPAGRRLCGELANQLGREVRWLGSHQRIEPVAVRSLGVFPDPLDIWPRLEAWIQTMMQCTEAPSSNVANDAQPSSARLAGDAQPSSARLAGDAQRPLQDASAPAPNDSDAPDLFALIGTGSETGAIPGGIALEAQCPRQPHTQLVLDQTGRLHLLHRHQTLTSQNMASAAVGGQGGNPGGMGEQAPDAALRAVIVELIETRQWVMENMKLLELTQRQLRFAPQTPPVLHLFTDRAELATALVARLGDTVKLHLLKRISVGAAHTWFCTPLS